MQGTARYGDMRQLSPRCEIVTALDEQIRRTEIRIAQQRLSIQEQQSSGYREAECRNLQGALQKLAALRKKRSELVGTPQAFALCE
jgi:regulator of protease activity HflC (stomatin/prohibitin superfamily)